MSSNEVMKIGTGKDVWHIYFASHLWKNSRVLEQTTSGKQSNKLQIIRRWNNGRQIIVFILHRCFHLLQQFLIRSFTKHSRQQAAPLPRLFHFHFIHTQHRHKLHQRLPIVRLHVTHQHHTHSLVVRQDFVAPLRRSNSSTHPQSNVLWTVLHELRLEHLDALIQSEEVRLRMEQRDQLQDEIALYLTQHQIDRFGFTSFAHWATLTDPFASHGDIRSLIECRFIQCLKSAHKLILFYFEISSKDYFRYQLQTDYVLLFLVSWILRSHELKHDENGSARKWQRAIHNYFPREDKLSWHDMIYRQ